MKKKLESGLMPALITTDSSKRGVFMGYIKPEDANLETIEAHNFRMCVYWSQDVKGVIGLAATGPTKSCRITKAAKRAVIKGVTAVVELTDEAVKAWEKEPWSN
jgi:hypothetical protein